MPEHNIGVRMVESPVFCWQVKQADHDVAPKMGVSLALIINHMHSAFGEIEMEVREVGRYAASKPLQ